jgi:hypothetical protein
MKEVNPVKINLYVRAIALASLAATLYTVGAPWVGK